MPSGYTVDVALGAAAEFATLPPRCTAEVTA